MKLIFALLVAFSFQPNAECGMRNAELQTKTIEVSFWCSPEIEAQLRAAFKTQGVTIIETPVNPDRPMESLYLTKQFLTFECGMRNAECGMKEGQLTVFRVKPGSDPCDLEFETLLTLTGTLETTVRKFVEERR